MNKILKISLLLLFTIPAFASMDTQLEKVLELHTKAMGGKEAVESIRSLEYSLQIQEPSFTVDAVYKVDRNFRMRIDVYAEGKRVYTEAFDGKQAWEMGEDGKPKDASPEGSSALRNGIFLGKMIGLHELSSFGHRVEYEGKKDVEGISYHVMKVTLDSGSVTRLYIHPESGLIERSRESKALHVDVDPDQKLTETKASGFRAVDGVMRAFRTVQTDLKTGQVMQTVTVKEIKSNIDFDVTLFRKPS